MTVKRPFIITIDTEGDNLWQSSSGVITTKNAAFLERFQSLCERYRFKPVYLTNYEMATDAVFVEFGKRLHEQGFAEIGCHLHAWNNPPAYDLTANDYLHKPYLIEYPPDIMRKKFEYQHKLLEDTFQCAILSHRAGRWAINADYVQLLLDYGYQVDCSVTPFVNWRSSIGAPQGRGGTDYSDFSTKPYFISPSVLHGGSDGKSSLLEVPMSTRLMPAARCGIKQMIKKIMGRPTRVVDWVRPRNNYNLEEMQHTALQSLADCGYVQFMLHSSEFMPGGSPNFRSAQDIETLYRLLDEFFAWLQPYCEGCTLAQYYQQYKNGMQHAVESTF